MLDLQLSTVELCLGFDITEPECQNKSKPTLPNRFLGLLLLCISQTDVITGYLMFDVLSHMFDLAEITAHMRDEVM